MHYKYYVINWNMEYQINTKYQINMEYWNTTSMEYEYQYFIIKYYGIDWVDLTWDCEKIKKTAAEKVIRSAGLRDNKNNQGVKIQDTNTGITESRTTASKWNSLSQLHIYNKLKPSKSLILKKQFTEHHYTLNKIMFKKAETQTTLDFLV